MSFLWVFEMRLRRHNRLLGKNEGLRGTLFLSPSSARGHLFDSRRVVRDLIAWGALGYGAHGWRVPRPIIAKSFSTTQTDLLRKNKKL